VAEARGGPVDYLEFGVYRGASLRRWLRLSPDPHSRFFGFDSFRGLPEAWELPAKTLAAGEYDAGGQVPAIDDERVRFVVGLFQEVLPGFLASYEPSARLVVHLDADLYSATLYALTALDRFLVPGTVLLFDELSAVHEFRAFRDWCEAYSRSCRLLGTAGASYAQAALEVTD
jgi:hypothetical protein